VILLSILKVFYVILFQVDDTSFSDRGELQLLLERKRAMTKPTCSSHSPLSHWTIVSCLEAIKKTTSTGLESMVADRGGTNLWVHSAEH
jgi:hypothetical protein